jgi:hypothetical protein
MSGSIAARKARLLNVFLIDLWNNYLLGGVSEKIYVLDKKVLLAIIYPNIFTVFSKKIGNRIFPVSDRS